MSFIEESYKVIMGNEEIPEINYSFFENSSGQ